MKWWKKKGLWFSVGFEVLGGAACLAVGLALICGFIVEAVIGAVVLGVIAIFASGGDISI
jgi:hypothetical protein